MKQFLFLLITLLAIASCNSGHNNPPVQLSTASSKADKGISVSYSEMNGVKTIPVKLNGVSMEAIYDSGCSGVHMSLLELQTLLKNGKVSEDDVVGTSTSMMADGSYMENIDVIINEIEIGGKDGIVIHDVRASVSLNIDAPLLLGNAVFDQVASVEVDNVGQVIKFKRN
ncbi:MAG: retroviral-like aspartic protease family protein [Bacteroides sp.]|nr:retroviral-like aspartic protease family protein [Bacteroides sp.]MCM1448058.1 retroviral-like aspartic protease family protein [Bacteroides sp.]